MLRLRTLGGLSLERTGDQSPGTSATSARRRLALLAVLAAESRSVPRDRLLTLFWPESDSERARHALDQSLYSLKRELKADTLFVGREELSLNPDVITSDIGDIRRALDRGERAVAAELYTEPFLDGVFIPGAVEFERWVDDQRARLARDVENALEMLATEAGSSGDHRIAVAWWRRLAAMDPRKTRVVVGLMSELAASGDRAGALRQAEVYQTLVRDDLEVEPNPAVAALAERLKREPAPATAAPSQSQFSPDVAPPFAGRYVIEREIGWGGTATVYLARDVRNDRRVALKVLRAELAAGIGIDRFRQEIALTANLQHPHILPVHDSGEADGTLYFVMPFVEGESLRARLERERRLSVSDVIRLAQEIASALAYAHARGIVHRDIKPENILITSGHAVVADFGLARALDDSALPWRGRRNTGPGMIVGTPAYLSPEQAMGQSDIDARSDQYMLAALLYESLAGTPPFAVDLQNPLGGRGNVGPPSLLSRRSDVPEHVDRAILRALSANPAHRFDDVASFARALSIDIASIAPTALLPPPAVEMPAGSALLAGFQSSRRVQWAMIAGIALLLVGAAWLTARSPALAERASIVVAGFDNHTPDSTFDRALDAALSTALEQSAYVTSVPVARIRQTLATMGRDTTNPASIRLTESTAREVAQRQGIGAVVSGTIDPVGSGYILSAKLIDARTGTTLAAEERTAKRREDILDALDDLVRALRHDIGESRATIAKHDQPLPLITTRSLDALRKYADGLAASSAGQRDAAMELWNAAVALDSDFAMAHAELGIQYYYGNNRPLGDFHFDRALKLADHLTDRERLHVRAAAASWRGDREGAITLRRTLLAEYPDDPYAWGQIGYDFMRLGRAIDAIDAYRRQLARDSSDATDFLNLAGSFGEAEQFDSSVVYYQRAFTRQPMLRMVGNIDQEYGSSLVFADRLDDARAAYETMLRGLPDQQARGHRSLGLLAMYVGHYSEAIDHFHRALGLSLAPDHAATELRNRLFVALAQQGYGAARRDSSRAELRAAFPLVRRAYLEPGFLRLLGVSLARDSQLPLAREILDTLRRRVQPNNADDQKQGAILSAEIALAAGRRDSAVHVLQTAYAADSDVYVQESLAHALEVTRQFGEAARMYEAIGASPRAWYGREAEAFGLSAPLQAGRLYERVGDTARARAAYTRLLSQWSKPDPDLPSLREARAAIARLSSR